MALWSVAAAGLVIARSLPSFLSTSIQQGVVMLFPLRSKTCGLALVPLAWALASSAHAVIVPSNASSPVMIGNVVVGQTYSVQVTGLSNLLQGFNGGQGLTFTADGTPSYAFPAPYAEFFPNGLDHDPSSGPAAFGPGGSGRLMGSLLGTFESMPTGPEGFFTIGSVLTFTATATGALYGLVNDNYYGDNTSAGFDVTLTPVPEPAAYVLLAMGLGTLLLRRRAAESGRH
jgi:hypothetical protein